MVYTSYSFLFENILKYNMLLSLEKITEIIFPFYGGI